MATTYGGQLRSRYSPDHIVAKAIVVRKSVGGNTVPVQVRPRLLCKNKITQLVERLLPVRGFESHFYFYKMEDKRMASGHPGKVLRRKALRVRVPCLPLEDIMKIIFCDVDGVLNNANLLREGGIDTIADSLLTILKKIIISTDAKIVLSSTWRINPDNRRLVREAFARHDMDFIDCTVDLWREDRSIEILEWLHRNPQVEKFAVLDDDPDAGTNGLHDSFFKTSFDVGLTEDIANKIILHLNI